MGAPPIDKRTDGRLNAKGIECLYLANRIPTCALEIRANTNNFISVGKFELKEDIHVIDLNKISQISPFAENLDPLQYSLNFDTLKKIRTEISKVQRSSETIYDYLPTQYISDFIRSVTENGKPVYSGIEYPSVVDRKNGINLGIFYPDLFECKDVKSFEITQTSYITEPSLCEQW